MTKEDCDRILELYKGLLEEATRVADLYVARSLTGQPVINDPHKG
jgi:hypothetical protein